jgi:hypothetical protein
MHWRTKMDRPTIDLSRGIPKSPEDWEWREYADWLEAENAKLRDENAGLLAACDILNMDNNTLREVGDE